MCTFRRDFNSNHIANTFSFIMAFVRANTISQLSPYCSIVPYNIRRRYLEPLRARGAARSTLKHTNIHDGSTVAAITRNRWKLSARDALLVFRIFKNKSRTTKDCIVLNIKRITKKKKKLIKFSNSLLARWNSDESTNRFDIPANIV